MQIGDKVWILDRNHRVYTDAEGNKTNSPWYRGYFVEHWIVGETKVSWIISRWQDRNPEFGFKVKKKNPQIKIYTSEEEVEKKCWVHDNRYEIRDALERCDDYDKLVRIKEILEVQHD